MTPAAEALIRAAYKSLTGMRRREDRMLADMLSEALRVEGHCVPDCAPQYGPSMTYDAVRMRERRREKANVFANVRERSERSELGGEGGRLSSVLNINKETEESERESGVHMVVPIEIPEPYRYIAQCASVPDPESCYAKACAWYQSKGKPPPTEAQWRRWVNRETADAQRSSESRRVARDWSPPRQDGAGLPPKPLSELMAEARKVGER